MPDLCLENGCHGVPGDILTLEATGLPQGDVASIWEAAFPGTGPAVVVSVGSYPCVVVNISKTSLRCSVSPGIGNALNVSIVVGGQATVSSFTFSYDVADGIVVDPPTGTENP